MDRTYGLASNDLLGDGSFRGGRLLHGHGVGVPGGLLGGRLLVGRLEPVEHIGGDCCWGLFVCFFLALSENGRVGRWEELT